jgi:hypothetical protein
MAGDGWLCVVCLCFVCVYDCQFGAARVVAGSCVSCVVVLCATSGVKVVEG